jgi:nitroreductase
MDLLEGLATTRAIRRFRDEPVTDEQLATILFAATRAPSGSNRQPFRFLVLRDGEPAAQAKGLLGGAARRFWQAKRRDDRYDAGSGGDPSSPKARLASVMQAFVDGFERVPVVVLAGMVRYRPPHPGEGASVYPACQNLLLAARAVGLGGVMTQWQGLCEAELRALLAVPDDVALHATIALGHPAGSHGPVRRRPLGEVVYEGTWGSTPAWAVDPRGTRFTQAGPPS